MHIAVGYQNTGKGIEYILYFIQKFCVISVIGHGNLMAYLIYRVAKGHCTLAVACHMLRYTVTVKGGVRQYLQYCYLCTMCHCTWQTHTGCHGKCGAFTSWPLFIKYMLCVMSV